MLFFVFKKLLFDYYVLKNKNIQVFQNIKTEECSKSPIPNERFHASGGICHKAESRSERA